MFENSDKKQNVVCTSHLLMIQTVKAAKERKKDAM